MSRDLQSRRSPKGDPENPLSGSEMADKFRALAGRVLPADYCERIDEGGRQVTLKPISQSRLGGDGGNEWLLGGALAGIGLLCLGGLVTAKFLT